MELHTQALYHFRWKNLDMIFLWEDEVLSLYS